MCGRSGESPLAIEPGDVDHWAVAGRKRTAPDVGFNARTMHRETVVLPQPNSPTSDSVSPLRMVRSRHRRPSLADDAAQETAPDGKVLLELLDLEHFVMPRQPAADVNVACAALAWYRKQLRPSRVDAPVRGSRCRTALHAVTQRGWKGHPFGRL